MKKIIFMIILFIACKAFSTTAYNGSREWLSIKSDTYKVLKITIPYKCTADETVKWDFNGTVLMVVIDPNGTAETNGTATITDGSGLAYATFAATTFAADRRYVITSSDSSGNVFGGCTVFGENTLRLIDCNAGDPIIIYIYCKK